MYHKVSTMCDKIRVIYDKSEQLRIMKYGHQDDDTIEKFSQAEVDVQIKDIQQMCREIANDKGKYGRYPAKKNA